MSKEVVCNWIPVSERLPDEGRLINEYLITVTRWSDVVCDCIETLPYSELIMSTAGLDNNSINARQGLDHNKKGGVIWIS